MSEFLIDEFDDQIWYDLKSYKRDYFNNVTYLIAYPNKQWFYVRPHRENGPAIIEDNGYQLYYIEGNLHHEDGPAEVNSDGSVFRWYLNNIQYSFEDWRKILNKSEEEINFLRLKWKII